MAPSAKITAILIGLAWIANALLMLLSPRSWFRLPRWTGVHGSMKYSDGRGDVAVRMLGVGFLGGFAWVVYDLLLSR